MNPANPLIAPSVNTEFDSPSRRQPKAQTESAEPPFKETLERQSKVSKVEPKDKVARPEKEDSEAVIQEKPVESKGVGSSESDTLSGDAEGEHSTKVSADLANVAEDANELVVQEGLVTAALAELVAPETSIDVEDEVQPLLTAQPSREAASTSVDLTAEELLVTDSGSVSELIDATPELAIHQSLPVSRALSSDGRDHVMKVDALGSLNDSTAGILSKEGLTKSLSLGLTTEASEAKPALAPSMQEDSSFLNTLKAGVKPLSGVSNAEQGLLLNSGKQSLNLAESGLATLESLDVAKVDKALLNPTKAGAGVVGVTTPQFVSSVEGRVSMPVNITFGEAGWATQVAERSAMVASQNIRFAELQLDPPELGPLQVKVTVNQDQASVSFVATNLQVKDALDQTIPKLRELLDEQGLNLANVDVSDQSSSQADEGEEGAESTQFAEEDDAQLEQESHQYTAEYGVDFYA